VNRKTQDLKILIPIRISLPGIPKEEKAHRRLALAKRKVKK